MRRHRPLASDLCRRFARGSSRAANLRWLTRCSCCPTTCAQDDGERQRLHHVPSTLHDSGVTWHFFPKRFLHASIGANHLRAQPKSQILARAPLISIFRLPRSRWMTLCPCRYDRPLARSVMIENFLTRGYLTFFVCNSLLSCPPSLFVECICKFPGRHRFLGRNTAVLAVARFSFQKTKSNGQNDYQNSNMVPTFQSEGFSFGPGKLQTAPIKSTMFGCLNVCPCPRSV
jgi:hypothetical protein